MWPSCQPSTPGYASCILLKIFHKISFLSYLRHFWLCTMSLFLIQQCIVAKTSQILTEIQNTVNKCTGVTFHSTSGCELLDKHASLIGDAENARHENARKRYWSNLLNRSRLRLYSSWLTMSMTVMSTLVFKYLVAPMTPICCFPLTPSCSSSKMRT